MLCAIAINVSFPILINNIAVSADGWSRLVLMFAIPSALIGMMRFIFVKETIVVEVEKEQPKLRDVGTLLKSNPYFIKVAIMWMTYSFVISMGIQQFFYQWVTGNIANMSLASMTAIGVVPLLLLFPAIMKRISMQKLVIIGCAFYIISGSIMFLAGSNMAIILVGVVFSGIGALPLTSLGSLLLIDCGSYNVYKGLRRMDGTMSALMGLAGKIGAAVSAGAIGFLLTISGYDGSLHVQPDSAILMIRVAIGIIPAVLFIGIAILFLFFKLEKMMPEVNRVNEIIRHEAKEKEIVQVVDE